MIDKSHELIVDLLRASREPVHVTTIKKALIESGQEVDYTKKSVSVRMSTLMDINSKVVKVSSKKYTIIS